MIPGAKAPPNSIWRTTFSHKGFIECIDLYTNIDDIDDVDITVDITGAKNHCAKNRKRYNTYKYATAGSEPMRPPWKY
jgi:hypothetical protein